MDLEETGNTPQEEPGLDLGKLLELIDDPRYPGSHSRVVVFSPALIAAGQNASQRAQAKQKPGKPRSWLWRWWR